VDIVTDGEIRRESYSNRFATALEGSTSTTRRWCPAAPAATNARAARGRPVRPPRPVEVEDLRFLRAHTTGRSRSRCPARSR
jgi:5-methyltetrahydropteroyltriglutamate--homocysteine methyltransferase